MKGVRVVALGAAMAVTLAGCGLLGLGGPVFSDDPISGEGVGEWSFVSGFVEEGVEEGEWRVELHAAAPAGGRDPWDFDAFDAENYIFFSAPSSNEPRELQLRLLFNTESNQTITYYAGGTNYIIIDGWLLLDVNETSNEATVKLDVTSDTMFFNGTVTLPVAP